MISYDRIIVGGVRSSIIHTGIIQGVTCGGLLVVGISKFTFQSGYFGSFFSSRKWPAGWRISKTLACHTVGLSFLPRRVGADSPGYFPAAPRTILGALHSITISRYVA